MKALFFFARLAAGGDPHLGAHRAGHQGEPRCKLGVALLIACPCVPQSAPQEVVSSSERTALAHLGSWLADLGVAPSAGGSSDDEDLVDDAKARSYVHAFRDQYARHSVAPVRLLGPIALLQGSCR